MNINFLPLPAGYTARGGHIDDYKSACELLNIFSQHLNDCVDLNDPEILRIDWLNEGFNPETDMRLIFAPDGTLVALVECWLTQQPPVHPWIFGRVHPDHFNKGLGSYMLNWAEARTHAALDLCPSDLRVAPRTGTEAHNQPGLALFEKFGWQYVHSFYRMTIDLDSAPEVPPTPAGITIRTYNPETENEAVYHTLIDSFRDHYGFVEQPFEKGFAEFKHNFIEAPGYDPNFWLVAMDGEEMAGICLSRRDDLEDSESGWVNELGVRRAWRKRGLGFTLLKHAFASFHACGKKRAGLGVDATSLTGATRLYERAGMHVQRQFNQYEKELRPGREISTQNIE